METTNIYILALEGCRFYVGKTKDVERRFLEHQAGHGSAWTRKYKPYEIRKIIPNASPFDEDRYVKEYMASYGINSVRGGSYSQIELDEDTIEFLEKEIRGASDCCTRCGRDTHFVKDCSATKTIDGKIIETEDDDTSDDDVICYRCGREGHYASECYAKKHKYGYYLK